MKSLVRTFNVTQKYLRLYCDIMPQAVSNLKKLTHGVGYYTYFFFDDKTYYAQAIEQKGMSKFEIIHCGPNEVILSLISHPYIVPGEYIAPTQRTVILQLIRFIERMSKEDHNESYYKKLSLC